MNMHLTVGLLHHVSKHALKKLFSDNSSRESSEIPPRSYPDVMHWEETWVGFIYSSCIFCMQGELS